ncbi:uncharacterized protein [Physcomitrium patens]|uniref:Uncharacterized protein n=1 Tax=Physcomitrium patens TaxID=3218 RepID=A0A2K1IHW2_PHYPA|nr:uncharacterized protein LOC112275607 [Physcomitrium patens]PNR28867.1 hypothetical protein PHYPA_027559 [Physcomitrium patens]|eukprot:XP_024361876.1 uncharacterized protein LOC112275607 [Physcomitrella patens]
MNLAGVAVLILAFLAFLAVRAESNPAVQCSTFNPRSASYCPEGRGSTCRVVISKQNQYTYPGCGSCTKTGNTVTCSTIGITFQFTGTDQVEISYNPRLITRVNQAAVRYEENKECRTQSRAPCSNPLRLTTPTVQGRPGPAICEVQVCYNPVDCGDEGSLCGDPKIVGGDGVMFYFHGYKGADFCLVSDSDLHINAHFIGMRPEGRTRDFTWVQGLGFVYGPHSLTVGVKKVAKWDATVDQLEFTYNGRAFELEGSSWRSDPDETMTINRVGSRNAVDVVVKDKMGVVLTALPIGHEENRVHKYGIGDDDCFAHFNMQFRFFSLSSKVNGVLGQTYQPGFVNPVKRGVAMPIMGGSDRFITSSLLATDCKVSQYTATAVALRDKSTLPNLTSCGSSASGALTCRR